INSSFISTTFVGAQLGHADFSSAILYGANFKNANLKQANFTGANIGCKLLIHDVDLNSEEGIKSAITEAIAEVTKASDAAKTAENEDNSAEQVAQIVINQLMEARVAMAKALLLSAKLKDPNTVNSEITDGMSTLVELQKLATTKAEEAGIVDHRLSQLGILNEFNFELQCQQAADESKHYTPRTNFSWANLTGAAFYYADVRYANFTRAVMKNTKFNDPGFAVTGRQSASSGASGTANLQGAIFDWADLTGACLSGADLSGARLQNTLMGNVELDETKLASADLSTAYVHPHAIESAICTKTTILPFNFNARAAYICNQNSSQASE
ncbi:MAG: pentapeptide repeat-containing protein, partial [Chloroflexota bacterium]